MALVEIKVLVRREGDAGDRMDVLWQRRDTKEFGHKKDD